MKPLFNTMMTAILTLLIFISILALSSPVIADDFMETRATADVSVMICPGCENESCNAGWLYNAQLFGSGIVDATIDIYTNEDPLVSQMWVESPHLTFCLGANYADYTPVDGHSEITRIRGGGVSLLPTLQGWILDAAVPPTPIPHIKINSPDLSGDGHVTLWDLHLFAEYYFGPYRYDIDYYWDGEINLLDVNIFVQHYGHAP